MRKFALVAAAALMAAASSAAKADFVFSTTRTTITAANIGSFNGSAGSPLIGDDLVVLSVINGAGTAQTGNVISSVVTESSVASSPQFFIRTYDPTSGAAKTYNVTTPSNNTAAAFGDEGTLGNGGRNSFRPDMDASFSAFGYSVNNGPPTSDNVLSSLPTENPPTYADYQGVPNFTVTTGIGGTSGISDATLTELAQAVVPAGQPVTFSGTLSSFGGTADNAAFSITNPVPEPASLAVVGFGAAGLLARRRRTA